MKDNPAPFEQAKKPGSEPRFLQIVAKRPDDKAAKAAPKLTRVAFTVSRLMEFCTMRELQNQTGALILRVAAGDPQRADG